jgi:hypothetical protein
MEDEEATVQKDPRIPWVLMAVVFGGGENQAGVESIVAAADFVNHAIINFDELHKGLSYLLRKEIIDRIGTEFTLAGKTAKRYKR